MAKTQDDDNGREVPEMPMIRAVEESEESCDVQMRHNVNTEHTVQPESSNTLIEKSDHTKEHCSLMEAEVSENNDQREKTKSEDMERKNIMLSEIAEDARDKAVPQTQAIEDGTHLSGIRVESAFSDEEENDYSNTGTTGAFRTPLQFPGNSPRTEKNSEGDDEEENWDEDEDSEPSRAGKHSNVGVLKLAENSQVEPNITSKQSKTGGAVSKQRHEIGNEKHITNDMKADNTVSQTFSQLSTHQGKADDDDDGSNEENGNDTTKPSKLILNLLRHKEEPEISEDTWGPGSDNEKEGSLGGDTSDIESGNLKFYESKPVRAEDWTVIHHDDDQEDLPVSMIVGSNDLEDTESHIRLPALHIAKEGELICHEEIPQTVIDDIDVTSHSEKDDEDEEHGLCTKVKEPVHHTVPEQGTLQVHGSLT